MGTFNSAVLPASTGLALGSAAQSWNITANTLTVLGNQTLNGVTSSSTNPASAGFIRAANVDAINFRNAANSADVNGISIGASNVVAVGGTAGISLTGPLQSNLRAGANGQVNLINYQGSTSGLTGTGVAKTIYTYTMPAGTMLANQGISVRFGWQHNTGAAAVAYAVSFGATTIDSWSSNDTAYNVYEVEIFNKAATNTQDANSWKALNGTFSANFPALAIDTTAAVIIKLAFTVAATDVVQGNYFRVLLLN